MEELTQRNEDLQHQLETAEKNASASVGLANAAATATSSGASGDGDGGVAEEVARLTRALEELRAGDKT